MFNLIGAVTQYSPGTVLPYDNNGGARWKFSETSLKSTKISLCGRGSFLVTCNSVGNFRSCLVSSIPRDIEDNKVSISPVHLIGVAVVTQSHNALRKSNEER